MHWDWPGGKPREWLHCMCMTCHMGSPVHVCASAVKSCNWKTRRRMDNASGSEGRQFYHLLGLSVDLQNIVLLVCTYWTQTEGIPCINHTTGNRLFAECLVDSTRQSLNHAECLLLLHSSNMPSPSLGRVPYYFLVRANRALGKVFAECPIENTRRTRLCRVFGCRVRYAVGGTRQRLCRVHLDHCRVP